MRTPLGDHFESARLAAGLSPGQLALRAGWSDAGRGGARVRELELGGRTTPETVRRVAQALGIDAAAFAELRRRSDAQRRDAWQRWADEPVPTQVSVRLLPGCVVDLALPAHLEDASAVLAWVMGEARRIGRLCCVVWSRRRCTYVRPDGTTYDVEARFEAPQVAMTMQLA